MSLRDSGRRLFLWLLLAGLAVLIVTLTTAPRTRRSPQSPEAPGRPPNRSPSLLQLEVFMESRDQVSDPGIDSASLRSLQEDQLLVVNPPQRRQSFKTPVRYEETTKAPEQAESVGVLQEVKGQPEQSVGEKHELNEETISPHRRLPEGDRHQCSTEQYSDELPRASVVICFHDDNWTRLLRTLHSVLDSAPKQYLQEVLLVDDLRLDGHQKTVLSEYVSQLHGVRLVQSTERPGVAGCRTFGAAIATGEVLVFMESLSECQEGWLEPLLDRVAQDRTRVVSPIMDEIDWQSFHYSATQWPVRGVFDWRLDFHWESNPHLRHDSPETAVLPVQSPALGGGVVAVDRLFFQSVGAYDAGLQQSGAEEIELSIRVWCCGGTMEVVPCSRVAQISRSQHTEQEQEGHQRNKARVADTWMDTYRKVFYRRDTLAHFIRQSERPDVTERLRLKRSLGCRNFRWFLSTVYPELYVPQDRPALSGELYSVGTASCADPPSGKNRTMRLTTCYGLGSQHCDLNSDGELRWGPMGSSCLDVEGDRVVLSPCPAHQPTSSRLKWKFMKLSGRLVHRLSRLCVEAVTDGPASGGLFLRLCTEEPTQRWHFRQLVP